MEELLEESSRFWENPKFSCAGCLDDMKSTH